MWDDRRWSLNPLLAFIAPRQPSENQAKILLLPCCKQEDLFGRTTGGFSLNPLLAFIAPLHTRGCSITDPSRAETCPSHCCARQISASLILGMGTEWNRSGVQRVGKLLKTRWPGTESNRRRQPFQGCALPRSAYPWLSATRLVPPRKSQIGEKRHRIHQLEEHLAVELYL